MKVKEEDGQRSEPMTSMKSIQMDDPINIYQNLENALQLSYLEEPTTLNIALRHIIRNMHEKGTSITFPQIEAIDKIVLASHNLPLEPCELLKLVQKVFERRNVNLDINEVYSQFARAHGRISFDPNQKWPQCNVYTRHP